MFNRFSRIGLSQQYLVPTLVIAPKSCSSILWILFLELLMGLVLGQVVSRFLVEHFLPFRTDLERVHILGNGIELGLPSLLFLFLWIFTV